MNIAEMDAKVETMMTKDKQEQLREMINEFRPIVAEIENGPELTQGHYGKYMQLLTGGSPAMTLYILLKAGANEYGATWAYKIITGQ